MLCMMHVFISLAQQAVCRQNSLENTLSTAIVYENGDALPLTDPVGTKMSYSMGHMKLYHIVSISQLYSGHAV